MSFLRRLAFAASAALATECVLLNKTNALRTQRVRSAAADAFLIVSGISAAHEMCVTASHGGSAVALEECVAAIAAGDGRELWNFQANGQLLNLASGKCAGLPDSGTADGGQVELLDCDAAVRRQDGRSQWAVLKNSQLQLAAPGNLCLTQRGLSTGQANVAARAAAAASSTVNAMHGAGMAVDGSEASYWASKFDDTAQPVTFTLDLGGVHRTQAMAIAWAFPAKAFSVSVSGDGVNFADVYATEVNVLNTTSIQLGSLSRVVKITMREPHAVYGHFNGHALYGIRSVAVHAPQLQAVVGDCAQEAKSSDARDKYFLSAAKASDPFFGNALRSELPSLEAAKASLAAATSDLADKVPQLVLCRAGGELSQRGAAAADGPQLRASHQHYKHAALAMAPGSGIDTETIGALVQEARKAIIAVRGALQ